jgi:hypothetical protein
MKKKYQTLSEFIFSPFNNAGNLQRDNRYDAMYRKFISENKIYVKATTKIEDSYYYLIKIPSESQKDSKVEYDVVIRFFTDNERDKKSENLRNYYIQFFSNSPSFIYTYAYIYNKRGYLVDTMYRKLDANYIDTPPTKTNADMTLTYDKSIYYACRYLSSNQFELLGKPGGFRGNLVKPDAFFKMVKDFNTVKIDQDLINLERNMKRTLEKEAAGDKGDKKRPLLSTIKDKAITTMTRIKTAGGRVPKKSARHTTVRKK